MAKVRIYRNLHKSVDTHFYSLKKGGKVFAYSELIAVNNAWFDVKENGRQRVLAEQRKNVHAFVICQEFDYIMDDRTLEKEWMMKYGSPRQIKYNPYVSGDFHYEDGTPVYEAARLILTENGIFSYE